MNFKGVLQIVPTCVLQTRFMDPSQLMIIERQLSEFNVYIKRDGDILIRVEVYNKRNADWNEYGLPGNIIKAIGRTNLIYNSNLGYPTFPKYLPYSFLTGCAEDDVVTFGVGRHNIDLTCSQGLYRKFGGDFETVLQNIIHAYIIKDAPNK